LALWCGFAALLVMFAVINTQMRNLLPAIAPPDRSLSQAKPMLKVTVPAAEGAASTAPLVSAAERKRADFKPPQKFPAPAAASIVAATPIAPAQPSETRLMEAAAPTQPSSAGILSDARTGSSAPASLAEMSKTVSPAPGATPIAGAAPPPAMAARSTAESAAAVAADDIAPATALSAAASNGFDAAAREFVQINVRVRAKPAQPPPPNVLSVFRLRRTGQNVRVVDADGSVYDGQVLSGSSGGAGLRGAGGGAKYGMATARQDTNEDANWSFKVIGTNNHLQQNIVFTGNVLRMPAAAPAGSAAAQNRNVSQLQSAAASAPVPVAQYSRITGKVQVGGGKEFEIEAKPPGL
jgi:hypothetical protein